MPVWSPIMRRKGERLVTCALNRSLVALSQLFRVSAWSVWIVGAIGGCLVCDGALLAEAGLAGCVAGILLTPVTFLVTPICVLVTQHDPGLLALNYGSLLLGGWLHNTAGCFGAAVGGTTVPQQPQAVP